MQVLQSETGHKGRFYIENNGKDIARMFYVWAGDDRIIIEHTETDEKAKGKGLGKQLVLAAVDFARGKGISVIPLCTFARGVFDRVPEIRDVL